MTIKMAEIILLLLNPKYFEPPIGRRKARIYCPVDGCDSVMIVSRWICPKCWKLLHKRFKRALNLIYKQRKICISEGLPWNYLVEKYWKIAARATLELNR